METQFESWKITDFNLDGRDLIISKNGLVKIIRTDDGVLSLVGDANHGLIDQESPSNANFARNESILGFVIDIGIQKEKWLSRDGFYFGMPLITPRSQRKVSQADFDGDLMEKIVTVINRNYQSGDKTKETEAVHLQLLLDAYNNARLLYPNFYADSYLGLMRIIDGFANARGSYEFALFTASVSQKNNQEIYDKLKAVDSYKSRLDVGMKLFTECLTVAKTKKWDCFESMSKLDDAGKIIFSCFYSSYQYRNKFVHLGFPFPDIVKDSHGLEAGFGTAYLNPALGISWAKIHRPQGLEDGDLIDIHQVVPDEDEAKEFKDVYFQLLPTWYFMKSVAREVLLLKILSLSDSDHTI